MNKNDFNQDFEEFMNTPSEPVPMALQQNTLSKVHEAMRVIPLLLFSKFATVYALTTLFVLYICPQFGVSVGEAPVNLMLFFMQWGHIACAALCGATLLGGVFLVTSLFLSPQESFWLRQHMPIASLLMVVFTLGILLLMGASAAHVELLLWAVFGFVADLMSFEVGRKAKVYLLRQTGYVRG